MKKIKFVLMSLAAVLLLASCQPYYDNTEHYCDLKLYNYTFYKVSMDADIYWGDQKENTVSFTDVNPISAESEPEPAVKTFTFVPGRYYKNIDGTTTAKRYPSCTIKVNGDTVYVNGATDNTDGTVDWGYATAVTQGCWISYTLIQSYLKPIVYEPEWSQMLEKITDEDDLKEFKKFYLYNEYHDYYGEDFVPYAKMLTWTSPDMTPQKRCEFVRNIEAIAQKYGIACETPCNFLLYTEKDRYFDD